MDNIQITTKLSGGQWSDNGLGVPNKGGKQENIRGDFCSLTVR